MQPSFPQPPAPPTPPRGGNGILLVLLGLGIVALLSLSMVVVFLVRGRPSSVASVVSPAPVTSSAPASKAASAHDQAATIDSLLDRSAASRAKLNNAIDRVRRCTALPGALSEMRAVGDERTKQIADLDAADVSALSNGATVKSTLRAALGYALAADAHFVAWAEPAANGECGDTAARDAAWERGQASSKQAQTAKKQFVAAWNPVAVPLGFTQRATDRI
ncbi:hypothetical protein [Actinoplanes sp. NPDC026619]|uniref:hypothetical protein n=1 Tax=Actinoplanes sp. NPDC026619 TaxID=3155798 RepID=UPI00340E6FBA